MKTIVPFTKEINLDSKVAEITSISLEYEMHIEDDDLEGNFIVSGEYRAHEISINTEPFCYRLPFSVEIGSTIDRSSVNFEIVDFNYELQGSDSLKVDIEFSVDAEELTIDEAVREEEEDSFIREEDSKDLEDLENKIELENEENVEFKNIELPEIEELISEELEDEKRIDNKSQETILASVTETEDKFMTYHIHIVRENENIESICAKYNVGVDFLKTYNEIDDIVVGDKLLIPDETD